MRQLNDFTCVECGTVTEHFVDSNIDTVMCSCGAEATKKLTAVTFKENVGRGATTKALLRWSKQRERKVKHERKASSSE